MLVIGIPTLNEEKNIATLVKKKDLAAKKLNLNVVIVNADSMSSDATVKKFKSTTTLAKKVVFLNSRRGKGINIFSIFNYASQIQNLDGCILIDGDVTSFTTEWLDKFTNQLRCGVDLVIPNYRRNYQEGNTTNHFVYPLVAQYFNTIPVQLIAGDFGLSPSFIKKILNKHNFGEYQMGYGIDIYITLEALIMNAKIETIDLPTKIHSPSFNKMEYMFPEVIKSMFYILKTEKVTPIIGSDKIKSNYQFFDPKSKIDRRIIIKKLIKVKKEISWFDKQYIDEKTWAYIIQLTTQALNTQNIDVLSERITPLFLMRVYTYLLQNSTPTSAKKSLSRVITSLNSNSFFETNNYLTKIKSYIMR